MVKQLDEITAYKYFGNYKNSYLAYASDAHIRKGAASGGVVSALLIYLLDSGIIDGALVCRMKYSDNGLDYEFIIAQTREEVLSAQTSKYLQVNFSRDAMPLIKSYNGRLAVVVLPCDAKKLKTAMRRKSELREKIKYVFCLFCGHNSQKYLLSNVLQKINISETDISKFCFRIGHWRGKMLIQLKNGEEYKFPSSQFLIYQNLFFFTQKKCLYCCDHTGYYSDISFGDVWDYRLKNEPVKYSSIVTKTDAGDKLFFKAAENEYINFSSESIEQIFQGQKRALPFHYNLTARAKAGRLVGLKIPSNDSKARWNDCLASIFVLLNFKLSQSKRYRNVIFKIPKPILQLYLYLIKLLQSF